MILQILFNFFQFIHIQANCITTEKSTYIIPSAQLCIPTFESGHDGYLFGPCNTSNQCDIILKACRFAKYRNKYCYSRDSHFCALMSSGNYTDYYLVECG